MRKVPITFERKLNGVVLLLAAFASLVAMGFIFAEGIWSGMTILGLLLIVILLAAFPTRS